MATTFGYASYIKWTAKVFYAIGMENNDNAIVQTFSLAIIMWTCKLTYTTLNLKNYCLHGIELFVCHIADLFNHIIYSKLIRPWNVGHIHKKWYFSSLQWLIPCIVQQMSCMLHCF